MSRILFNELSINSGFVLNDLSEKVINEITNEITWIGRQNGITLSPEIKTERTEPERVTTELLISYNGSSPKPGKLNRHFPGAQHTAKWISHENQKMDRQTLSFNKENRAKLIFQRKILLKRKDWYAKCAEGSIYRTDSKTDSEKNSRFNK